MTETDRLNEIEKTWPFETSADVRWLIARVRELEAQLAYERVAKKRRGALKALADQ